MIQIAKTAQNLKCFLTEKGVERFKIFVRINFSIDVFIFTSNTNGCRDIMEEYLATHLPFSKISYQIISVEELNDPFYSNILSGGINVIDWGPHYRLDSLLSNHRNISIQKEIPIITFYSYKGGMGRTTTMVSYAMDLAINHHKRVVIVDCDLEAPGYLNFFNLSKHVGLNNGKTNGLVEFLSDAHFVKNVDILDINDYMINVGLGNENSVAYNNLENIWLVPAGNLNSTLEAFDGNELHNRKDYLEGLSRVNLSNIQSITNGFQLLFKKIKETVRPDFILIDSRTGFNDIFGTAAFYLSDTVICFFGFSLQTQPGIANMINEYYNNQNSFKLHIVYSILPPKEPNEKEPDWVWKQKKKIDDYINDVSVEGKDFPICTFLHRNTDLERIGLNEDSDAVYVKMVRERTNDDYNHLFKCLNGRFIKTDETKLTSIQLRNVVLKHLKDTLAEVHLFAEDTTLNENRFFYRDCMKDLFNPKKYLIRGSKGTGKTYLYKALTDQGIAQNIQKWAGQTDEDISESQFVQILSPQNGGQSESLFTYIPYGEIKDPELYFTFLWQIYTWNAILMLPDFEIIKNNSAFSEYVQPIINGNDVYTLTRFQEIIGKGLSALVELQKDLSAINQYLKEKGKKLFVLYDQLDTQILPNRWNIAVSPLINYWRNNYQTYSNLIPKIFVRTDLYKLIYGTNTIRLEDNIIDIEWTIGEIFGYFFKLIFSNDEASKAYWQIAEKVGIDKSYIKNTKQSFRKGPNYNQFKSFELAEMFPIIQVFFGKQVVVNSARLGNPWEYFSRELATADGKSMSLRPFINTLNNNSVEQALARTEKYVQEIISPEIYASKDVRDKTTNEYFDDLTRDAYSKNLTEFRYVIRTAGGEKYRFKSLSETLFEELISAVFDRIDEKDIIRTTKDLKDLIFANGIMAEKITNHGRYFRFAPIYWYTWGLANSDLENEEKRYERFSQRQYKNNLEEGKQYEGVVIPPFSGFYKRIRTTAYDKALEMRGVVPYEFNLDDVVIFTAEKEPNKKTGGDYWYATDVRLKED